MKVMLPNFLTVCIQPASVTSRPAWSSRNSPQVCVLYIMLILFPEISGKFSEMIQIVRPFNIYYSLFIIHYFQAASAGMAFKFRRIHANGGAEAVVKAACLCH